VPASLTARGRCLTRSDQRRLHHRVTACTQPRRRSTTIITHCAPPSQLTPLPAACPPPLRARGRRPLAHHATPKQIVLACALLAMLAIAVAAET
jgi:hypothetical protein